MMPSSLFTNPTLPLLLLVAGCVSILPSCYYDVEEGLYSETACQTDGMSYQTHIKPILDSKCNGCHSSASRLGGIALDTYADVSSYAADGKLLGVVKHTSGYSPMPKNESQLPDCTIAQIEAWIADGFPDN